MAALNVYINNKYKNKMEDLKERVAELEKGCRELDVWIGEGDEYDSSTPIELLCKAMQIIKELMNEKQNTDNDK